MSEKEKKKQPLVSKLLSYISEFPPNTSSLLPLKPAWHSPHTSQIEYLYWSRFSRSLHTHLLPTSFADLLLNEPETLNFSLTIKLWILLSQGSRRWDTSKPAPCLWLLFGAGWLSSACPFFINVFRAYTYLKLTLHTKHINLSIHLYRSGYHPINNDHFNEARPYSELLQ